jgi:hypothetical protein
MAPSMLSCLLVIVAGAIQRRSILIGSPDPHDLVKGARAIVYYLLDHPGNLDIVESEAIQFFSATMSTILAALPDGSAILIEHLLRELSGKCDEIAGNCGRLVGDLYVIYSPYLVPFAEPFMTMLFQRVANSTLGFLPTTKLFHAVGDILASLESNETIGYRDAIRGVLPALARIGVHNN